MADVVVTQTQVTIRVTETDWKLIMKSLAYMAGVKLTVKGDEGKRAADLNKSLLGQRVHVLKEQLKVAEGALQKADEDTPDPDHGTFVLETKP